MNHSGLSLSGSSSDSGQRIEFANSLRGLACISVVFAHYAGVFWEAPLAVSSLTGTPAYQVSASQMPYLNWLNHAIPRLQWGPFGVAIFFLVSGFVIPYSLERYSTVRFLLNRVLRIWPTYICGFAVTVAMVMLGAWSYGAMPPFNLTEVIIHTLPGLRDIIGSRNVDGIVWTLEIEVKFYVLCAIVSPFIRRKSPLLFVAPLVIGVAALLVSPYVAVLPSTLSRLATAYINASQYLVYMFIGVAFHLLFNNAMNAKHVMAWTATLGVLVCLIWSNSPYNATFPIAWSYAMAVCVFAWAMSVPSVLRSNRFLDFVAAISYPLYVVHGVAGYVLMRWFFDLGVPAFGSILLTVVASTSVAYFLHLAVEKPCQAYAKRTSVRQSRPLEVESQDRMAA